MREDDVKIITLRFKPDNQEELQLYMALERRKEELGISMPSLVKRILLAELEDENDCVDFQNYLDERLIEQEKSLQRLIHEQLQSLSAILINTILNTKVHSDVKLEGSSISSEQLQGQYDMEELPEISNELPEEFDGVLEMFLK